MRDDKTKENWEYLTIDNNWARYPYAFCMVKKRALTWKQMRTHKCKKKKCTGLDLKMQFE